MNAIAKQLPGVMSADHYLRFLETRPDGERWQLIDGMAIMMTPPTVVHQVIAMNLAMLLNVALQRSQPDLMAIVEPGVSVPSRPDFLPRADVAIVSQPADYVAYAARVFLTAEIRSASNTQEYMARKVLRYSEHPDNLYALVISQRRVRVDLRARADDWKLLPLTAPDAVLELPEFDFRCLLADLYRGTPLA